MKDSIFHVLILMFVLSGCESIGGSLDKCNMPQPEDRFECDMTKGHRMTYDEYKALEKRDADRKSLGE